MPRYVGTAGAVHVGGQAVAEVQSFEVNVERNAVQARVMGQTWTGQGIGPDEVSGTVTCFTDPADATGQAALRGRNAVALTLYPQGVGAGLPQLVLAQAFISAFTQSEESGEFSTTEFSFVADSALDETPQS